MAKLFITGATGTVGSEVIRSLTKVGTHQITAASRTAKEQSESVLSATFDFADPTTFSVADGHDAVFLLGPPVNPGLYELLTPFVDYLLANGRPRVVYLSGNGMQDLPALPFHGRMEARLKASGLEHVILRPGFFATNFGLYERENIEQRGIIFNPSGKGKTTLIAPSDIGAVAAIALTDPNYVGKTYTLTGNRLYTMQEVAELLTKVTGKPIVYPEPSNETYREVLKQGGAPDFIADYMIPIYNLIRDGKADAIHDDVRLLTGREPRSFEAVLKEQFS